MAERTSRRQMLERFLSKLPLEDQVDAALNSLAERVAGSPLVKRLEDIHGRLPVIPERSLPTPFGTVRTPEIKPPEPVPPKIDGRRREAMKAAIAIDLSFIVAVVPVVGDAASDVVGDIYTEKLKRVLTAEEFDLYIKYDRVGPSSIALARTFGEMK